ncbi:hypothetical protein G9A89_023152 [Geosiphon pyriformis]|nr:hypothetical protein G9A89_023152 [Geosiphon pyriformis]
MSTQFPVFAVGSVIEDAIEKDKELWLVLQDMRKAYDSVEWYYLRASLWCVKMCERFIRFFGGIHENRVNRVMTDFGLSGGYKVHNGLDQGEVFSSLLWRIFYDPLLCEVKRHEQLCGYWIDTKFVSKSGRIESNGGLTLYFSAGAFVDDMIWVGNCQASTQYALNIASEFFVINDISINSEKTVAIPINQDVKVALLSICSQPISIAKKRKAHQYLGIFLSTERLSKSSVVKTHVDVHFFINVVFRKAITDKQFSYLVSAVLQPIVSYRIQFSFVSSNRNTSGNCKDSLREDLRQWVDFSSASKKEYINTHNNQELKNNLHRNSKKKAFSVTCLFRHRFLDLQILGWAPLDLLQFLVRLCVSPVNNFLAGMVKILLGNELSLVNNLSTVFHSPGHFPLSFILGKSLYFDLVKSLRHFGVTFGDWLFDKKSVLLDWKTFCYWKRLDLHGSVPHWFLVSSEFLKNQGCSFSGSIGSVEKLGLDILEFGEFSAVKDELHNIWSGFFEVFTDGSLRNADFVEITCGAAAYFPVLNKSISIAVSGFLSSTIAELQAVALALECIPSSSTVVLCLDSQAAIDACVSEMSLVTPDFRNQCWLERHHIFNLVKDHSEILSNVEADLAARAVSGSPFSLCANVCEHFLVAGGVAVSEAGPGCNVVLEVMIGCIDWAVTAKVWHPDSHMLTGFTSWLALADSSLVSAMLQVLSQCFFDVGLYTLVCKGFVLGEWYEEAYSIFENRKVAATQIVDYVRFVVKLHHAKVWLARASHQVVMEKTSLICDGGVVSGLSRGVSSVLSNGVVRLLGVANSFAVSFGHQKSYCFFSGLGGSVQVIIDV